MRTSLWICLTAAALCGTAPTPARAQDASGRFSTVAECTDRHPLAGVAQALGVNLVVNRLDVWMFDYDWARVNFGSWSKNLELGWQWDETQFAVNMFVHPYHGSLYFNAARANCLTFWEAVPITFLGSWTWEFFGEKWRPSLNDFWMTGYGGVALGEIIHRVSSAIIDEQARGGGRIAREFAALAVDPVGGVNRLFRGQWTRRGPNPPDRLPESYVFSGKFGFRGVEQVNSPDGPIRSPTLIFNVSLGDAFETEYQAPYDVVDLFAQISPDGGGVNNMRAVGRLYPTNLNSSEGWHRHQLQVSQRFTYVNNPVYKYGEQSFELGLASRWRIGIGDVRLNTRLAGNVVALGAIDALDAGFGYRDIDYGPGLGAIFEASLDRGGYTFISFYNRARYLRSVSGAPANHNLLFSGLDISIPLSERLGVGAYLSGDRRRSYYFELPKTEVSYVETRFYVTWAFAQGVPGAQ